MDSFYSQKEIENLGFGDIGVNVKISRKASFYNPENIFIGNNVRIDDFCILSGNIEIRNYVHIAAYSALYGDSEGIFIDDYSNISSRVMIYAVSDDYSGMSMTNPTIPIEYKNLYKKKVTIKKHVIIGSGCTILPGCKIGEGCAIGCMSLVNKDLASWFLYAGIPAKIIRERKKDLLELEKQFEKRKLDN